MSPSSNRMHPLIAMAAISVILVSLLGVAAITGVLPISHSSSAPIVDASTQAAAPAPASTYTSAPVIVAASAPLPNSAAPYPQTQPNTVAPAASPAICKTCGQIASIHTVQHQAKPTGVGIVAGAVLGGVLGNQIGAGNGRALATVAGAAGGGYAGNEVEKRTHTTTSYQVRVRMENGNMRTFSYAEQPGLNVGDRVRVVNGGLTLRS